jgi:cyclohexanecarboxylate-CoA ligase
MLIDPSPTTPSPTAPSSAAPLKTETLWSLLESRSDQTPNALMFADEFGRRMTFREFTDWCERLAAGFFALGIQSGTAVSWQLPSRIETVAVSMALSRLGAVQNPIINLYREREVSVLLRDTHAAWYLHPGVWKGFDYEAMANSIQDQRLHDRSNDEVFAMLRTYDELPLGDPATLPPPPHDGDAVTWIYSTSGTTSEPKGVQHCDHSLMAAGLGITTALQPNETDVFAIPFPYAHIGGPDNLVMTLLCGGATVLTEGFVPADTFALFDRLGVTRLGGSTAHYAALVAEEHRLGRNPVPTLHTICGGGAPKPPELYWRVKERTGVITRHGYGMTECPMIACGKVGDTDEQLAQTEGSPVLGCEILVVDSNEHPVAAGVDGDVLVRGPMLAKGYLDPEQTRESFRTDGWFRTGDRGHLRTDGHIVLTGRSKDLIIRKGENISPREIEDVLASHVSVGAIAVVGLPDVDRGERVCAVVETTPGATPLTFAAMAQHCRDAGLMTQKIPEQLEIVDALPRNPTMKILKRVLVEMLTKT